MTARRALLAAILLPFAGPDKAAAQPVSPVSPEAPAQRRNRRIEAERDIGGGAVPIPVAPESGGMLTRLDQPTVFFLLKEKAVADIELLLQRANDPSQSYKHSVGVQWGRGLHAVHFADTPVRLLPDVPVDWTLTLQRIGHPPAAGGATIVFHPPAPGLAQQIAALTPGAAVDTLLQGNYWYDAFLLAMQSPPETRETLVRKLLAKANIDVN